MIEGQRHAGIWRLAEILMEPSTRSLSPPLIELHMLLSHPRRVIQALACDVLNDCGEATVPGFLSSPQSSADAVEALRPAYAAQVFRMAEALVRHGSSPGRTVNVDSPFGLPAAMLAELLPGCELDGVESGCAGHDALVSVSTSHHTDACAYLANCSRVIRPGGLLVIADEFITAFESGEERARNLIAHRWAYVQETLRNVDSTRVPPLEQQHLERFRALPDHPSPAELRSLLAHVVTGRADGGGEATQSSRVRFAVRELETLVEALDHAVERAMHAAKFASVAADHGLALIEHTRVRGTHGADAFDAGTHVFCFRSASQGASGRSHVHGSFARRTGGTK